MYVYGYTNAGFQQKIVATPESGSVITMTGQGEGNKAMSPPSAVINTPSTGSHLNGFQVQVQISNMQNNTWVTSQTTGAGCSLAYTAATYLVVSEDLVDNDWNDALIMFLWYNPPVVSLAMRQAKETLAE